MKPGPEANPNIEYPSWQREYHAAASETNPLLLGEKIHAAETAMSTRMQAIRDTSEGAAERQAISEALNVLQQIQIKVFGHPDWQT
jgi:hypothetical protein